MSTTTSHAAHTYARNLAEAILLQSMEDLWNPRSKQGSMLFFEGAGFTLCAEIAGISHIKRLALLRMLADTGKTWGALTDPDILAPEGKRPKDNVVCKTRRG